MPSNNNDQPTQPQHNPLLTKIHTLPKELRNLIAGGLAGMVAKTFVAPIDRIKILYQVTSAHFRIRDVPAVAYSIIEKEGYSALWKGNLATMIRVFPYSGIQFMVFDRCKMHFLHEKESKRKMNQLLIEEERSAMTEAIADGGRISRKKSKNGRKLEAKTEKGGLTPSESLISGMIAGTISVLCTYPLDLARAQLAVLRKKKKVTLMPNGDSVVKMKSKGLGYVLSNSFRQGGAVGLYRGITPTLLGILPYSGIAFTINEQAKRQITHIFQREPTTFERLQCGALSGLFAQSIAYPLEVTRRRMQTIGIVPTSGSESAAINFTGVTSTKPSVDELPQVICEQQQQQNQKLQPSNNGKGINSGGNSSVSASADGAIAGLSQSNSCNQRKPPDMITTMRHLFEEQGLRGFFKGVSMNWIKGPIAFSISFTAFDTIQGWIETDIEKERKSQLTRASIKRRLTNNDD